MTQLFFNNKLIATITPLEFMLFMFYLEKPNQVRILNPLFPIFLQFDGHFFKHADLSLKEFRFLFTDGKDYALPYYFYFLLYLQDHKLLSFMKFPLFVSSHYSFLLPNQENDYPLYVDLFITVEKELLSFLMEHRFHYSFWQRFVIYFLAGKMDVDGFFHRFDLTFKENTLLFSWLNMNIKFIPLLILISLATFPQFFILFQIPFFSWLPLYASQQIVCLFLTVYIYNVYRTLLFKGFILAYQSLYIPNLWQRFVRIFSFPFLVFISFSTLRLGIPFFLSFHWPLALTLLIFANLRFWLFALLVPKIREFTFPFSRFFYVYFEKPRFKKQIEQIQTTKEFVNEPQMRKICLEAEKADQVFGAFDYLYLDNWCFCFFYFYFIMLPSFLARKIKAFFT